MKLATIGYESATLDAVIAALREAKVDIVIDVRAVASSRRAGFSKTILRESLAEAGIGYEHLRGLGTPKPGREAARKGRIDEMHDIFNAHMKTPEAVDGLARAIEIAKTETAALLCYEDDPAGCHRRIVAQRMVEETGAGVVDLMPARS